MKLEYDFSPITKFLLQYDQPAAFAAAMIVVILLVLFIGLAAVWLHEKWLLRKMRKESLRDRSRASKVRT